jgi:hypothetical protein
MILSQLVHFHLTSALASQIEHCFIVADFGFLIPPEVAICQEIIKFIFNGDMPKTGLLFVALIHSDYDIKTPTGNVEDCMTTI